MIFALNVLLFVLFSVMSVVRYTVFKGLWGCMVRHPVQSLFLGRFAFCLVCVCGPDYR